MNSKIDYIKTIIDEYYLRMNDPEQNDNWQKDIEFVESAPVGSKIIMRFGANDSIAHEMNIQGKYSQDRDELEIYHFKTVNGPMRMSIYKRESKEFLYSISH